MSHHLPLTISGGGPYLVDVSSLVRVLRIAAGTNLDVEKLRDDINLVLFHYSLRRQVDLLPTEIQTAEFFERLLKAVRRLEQLIPLGINYGPKPDTADNMWVIFRMLICQSIADIDEHHPDELSTDLDTNLILMKSIEEKFARMIKAIRDFKRCLELAVVRDNSDLFKTFKGIEQAERWLFAIALPQVFSRHLDRHPGLSRTLTQEPSGPYFRFASELANQVGIRRTNGRPYAPETIADFISRPVHRSSTRP